VARWIYQLPENSEASKPNDAADDEGHASNSDSEPGFGDSEVSGSDFEPDFDRSDHEIPGSQHGDGEAFQDSIVRELRIPPYRLDAGFDPGTMQMIRVWDSEASSD